MIFLGIPIFGKTVFIFQQSTCFFTMTAIQFKYLWPWNHLGKLIINIFYFILQPWVYNILLAFHSPLVRAQHGAESAVNLSKHWHHFYSVCGKLNFLNVADEFLNDFMPHSTGNHIPRYNSQFVNHSFHVMITGVLIENHFNIVSKIFVRYWWIIQISPGLMLRRNFI